MKILTILMKRTLRLGLLAFTVTSATFFLVSLIPGDFFTALEANPNIRPETVTRLREQYGLGDPVHLQYVHWVQRSLHLDFGYSLFYGSAVSFVVANALSNTLWMGVPALARHCHRRETPIRCRQKHSGAAPRPLCASTRPFAKTHFTHARASPLAQSGPLGLRSPAWSRPERQPRAGDDLFVAGSGEGNLRRSVQYRHIPPAGMCGLRWRPAGAGKPCGRLAALPFGSEDTPLLK